MKPIVAGYLEASREDLAAVRQLIPTVPRAAAYHLQQAAEKLVKAVLSQEAIHMTVDHSIDRLVERLPHGHEWRIDLKELDFLSQFATSFRYPSPSGRLPSPPDKATLERYVALIEALSAEVEAWCRGRV